MSGASRAMPDPPAASLPSPGRILLVDDHQGMRRGLRRFLDAEPALRVVAEAASGDEALRLADTLRPDLVILDANLPEISGPEVARAIRHRLPETAILFLTMEIDQTLRQAATAVGASACLLKDSPLDVLLAAVHAAVRHGGRGGVSTPATRRETDASAAAREPAAGAATSPPTR